MTEHISGHYRSRRRRMRQLRRRRVVGVSTLIVCAGLIAHQVASSSPASSAQSLPKVDPTATSKPFTPVMPVEGQSAPKGQRAPGSQPGSQPGSGSHGHVTVADGLVPDGVTVLDDGYPAVSKLDPDLLVALRAAAADAAGEGISFYVNSGWRSKAYQQQLLDEAISKYGSQAEAARWVATPQTSPHVSGDAVDIGKNEAAAWLTRNGAAYGLCRIYANEPWHFELREGAAARGCPLMYADPTHDPRMQ